MSDHLIDDLISDIVTANQILASEGVVDAFGHISARHPGRPDHYFMSWAKSPQLVTAADVIEFKLDGTPATNDPRKRYLEHFIHGALYEARPDVQSVVHSHSRSVVPFSVASEPLRPVSHSCATIGAHIPVWDAQANFGDTNLLISNMEMARDFADVLANNTSALMRGHGSTVVGRSVREVVYTAVYLEVNAGLQLHASRFPPVKYLTEGEISIICGRLRDAKPSEGYDRAWNYWCQRAGIEARQRAPQQQ
jgi:HCOMODA/2-hydroxy-3-carboxy-muconic semialdehyde decarboxylase